MITKWDEAVVMPSKSRWQRQQQQQQYITKINTKLIRGMHFDVKYLLSLWNNNHFSALPLIIFLSFIFDVCCIKQFHSVFLHFIFFCCPNPFSCFHLSLHSPNEIIKLWNCCVVYNASWLDTVLFILRYTKHKYVYGVCSCEGRSNERAFFNR